MNVDLALCREWKTSRNKNAGVGWLLKQNSKYICIMLFVFHPKAVEAEAEAEVEGLAAAVIPTTTGVMTEDMTDMKNMIIVTGT